MTGETDPQALGPHGEGRDPTEPERVPEPVGEGDDVDRVLIGAMAVGEPRAMERFYDRHMAFVAGILRPILGDQALVEETLQDVFWQAWRTAGHYDPLRGSPRTWLYQMARSRALDARRRMPREVVWEDVESEDPDPAAEAAFADVEGRAFLRRVKSLLPPEEALVMHLVFERGLTQAQAASRLHIPLGTAKGRVRSALKRLRSLLPRNADGSRDTGRGDR